jgi:hypothetical protein
MQEFIEIFKTNQTKIEQFLLSTIKHSGRLQSQQRSGYKPSFEYFPSLELIYVTDASYLQISPNFYKNSRSENENGHHRAYLTHKLHELEEGLAMSAPYISSATGSLCITLRKQEGKHFVFLDFKLSGILARLGLIELHPKFNRFTKNIYKLIGYLLTLFALFAIGYALFGFGKHLIMEGFTLNTLFKPIIAITLGLAIFDLAKTILEREVYYKSYAKESDDSTVLTKFTIAIIIALSIEALMVVFKIALHDYREMVYGLYLILGVSAIILSLGFYSYLQKR